MTTKFVERKTHLYKIDDLFDENNKILYVHPEQIVLDIYSYKFDIGGWYYSEFKENKSRLKKSDLVNLHSYEKDRVGLISAVLKYIYLRKRMGVREITIIHQLANLKKFYRWCDKNKQELVCNFDLKYAKKAYCEYIDDLQENVRLGLIKSNYANSHQLEILRFFDSAMPGSNLVNEALRIGKSSDQTDGTNPANNTKELYIVYDQIFNQFSDFVLNCKQYPHKFQIRKDFFWCVPVFHSAFQNENNRNTAFDYDTGVVRSFESVYKTIKEENSPDRRDSSLRWAAQKKIDDFNEKILIANQDKYHHARLRLASLASDAFVAMFLLETGMSQSQMSDIPWNDGVFDVESVDIKFKLIKYRANRKPVEFGVGYTFVKKFKKYLKLRDFVLKAENITEYSYLFYEYKKTRLEKNRYGILDFNATLIRNFGLDEVATPRQLRSFKNNEIQDMTGDFSQTSVFMQHTNETSRKSYYNGTAKNQAKEMTDFFHHFGKNIVISNEEEATDIAYGVCRELKAPVFDKNPPINPDCVNSQGCLFCGQFAVHGDRESYKKLLHLEMLIDKSRILARNSEHHSFLFKPIYERIELYKSAIIDQSEMKLSDIESCKQEVISGQSNTFFMRTLNLIYELA